MIAPHGLVRLTLLIVLSSVSSLVLGDDLATKATGILKAHCYECHGAKRQGDPDYAITDLAYLEGKSGLIVAGDSSSSRIMKRIYAGEMPPGNKPKLTKDEADTVRAWIDTGAAAPAAAKVEAPRQFVPTSYVRTVIGQDTLKLGGLVASDARYLSLVNLYNAGQTKEQLAASRRALSKALNSLSLAPRIVRPVPVDKDGLVMRVSLASLGWTVIQWNELLNAYPYLEAPAFIRADWFIATALKPPLYYSLLRLPSNQRDLETDLGVDRDGDINANIAQRAAITDSTVAIHNRVLEYHPAVTGLYRLSYDTKNEDADRKIIRNPLGPQFGDNPFGDRAFKHDASEVIFDLPNGLHGYYAANGQGVRVDAVPNDVANDTTQLSGSPNIVPGLSCIGCHSQGIQTKISDVARAGSPVNGLELAKVAALYPQKERFSAYLEKDKSRYLKAELAATGQTDEPIRVAVEAYDKPIDLATAAKESDQADPRFVAQLINTQGDLQAEGLRPLIEGKTITRDTWQSAEFNVTPAQRVAQLLGEF